VGDQQHEMAALDELDRQLLREGHSRPSADFFQTRNSTAASPRAWVRSATSASSCCSDLLLTIKPRACPGTLHALMARRAAQTALTAWHELLHLAGAQRLRRR
jgi:hypothetical protein